MKYCAKCGAEMPDDSKFCTKCGGKLNGEPVESPSNRKKPMLVGVGAVLVVAVIALVVVLSKGKGSDNPDVAASSSNVSTEKESGDTEKPEGLLDIGGDKKWEKEYAERLDAYLEYYEEHEKDADTVYGWVLLNKDNLPYMVLENAKFTGNHNGYEDYTFNVKVLDYIDDNVELIAERQFERGVLPNVLSNVCFIDGDGGYLLKDGRFIEITEKDFGSESEMYLSPYVSIEWDSANNRIGEVYEDSFYYDISVSPYAYIGRNKQKFKASLSGEREATFEAILSGEREATVYDFYKEGDEIFYNNDRYYIGSDECYSSDFYKELLSHYGDEEDSDNIICSRNVGVVDGESVLDLEKSVLYGASFRTFLRELRKRPVGSIEELVGFYLEFLITENGFSEYDYFVISKDSCAVDSDKVYQQPSQGEIEEYLEKERSRVEVERSSAEISIADEIKLNREQVRRQNKVILSEILNNPNMTEEQKQSANDAMNAMMDDSRREEEVEKLLREEGFTDVVVCIEDGHVSVFLDMGEVTDEKQRQVEEIVKSKTDTAAENITITPIQDLAE